jgi:hypothetical protein
MNRIVLTEKHVIFSKLKGSYVLDMIPFQEIMDVVEVEEDSYLPLTAEDHESVRVLQITTADDGYNCGRIYRFRLTSESFKSSLLQAIRQNLEENKKILSFNIRIGFFQRQVRDFYNAKPTQCIVAVCTMSVSLFIDYIHKGEI